MMRPTGPACEISRPKSGESESSVSLDSVGMRVNTTHTHTPNLSSLGDPNCD